LRPGCTYFNFLSSHDGVGLRPLEGLLGDAQRQRLLEVTAAAGGEVSYRSLPEGTQSPYELNSTWFDLMAAGHAPEIGIQRHLSSHAIALALPGLVGLYVHSLFGGSNDREGFARTRRNRTLNRRRFRRAALENALDDPDSTAHQVFDGMSRLIALRRSCPAFAPESSYEVLDAGLGLFAIERGEGDHRARVYVDVAGSGASLPLDGSWVDLETGEPVARLEIGAFANRWLRAGEGRT
jgi:sucrose phosphorylase